MKNKSALVLLSLLILGLLCSTLSATIRIAQADPSPTTDLYLTAPALIPPVGESFNVSININNVTNLWFWAVSLEWNPTVLLLTNASEGSFLQSGGQTLFLAPLENPFIKNGTLPEIASCLFSFSGVNGSGVLAILTFQVISCEPTNITITSSEIGFHPTEYTGNDYEPIPHTNNNLSICLSDIPIINATTYSFVETSFILPINMTLQNNDTSLQQVTVNVFANSSLIHTESLNLTGASVTNFTCACNTTNLGLGNYTVSAIVLPSLAGTSWFSNSSIITQVLVTYVGDLTGDFQVNFYDLVAFTDAYIAYNSYGIVNPAADFNHDNAINFVDQVAMVDAYNAYQN